LNSKQVPGVFGATSPEEDFVETYKTLALNRAGLSSLTIGIPEQTDAGIPTIGSLAQLDLVATSQDGSSALARRAKCIGDLGLEEP
jgi:hypothetical protein